MGEDETMSWIALVCRSGTGNTETMAAVAEGTKMDMAAGAAFDTAAFD